MNTAEKLSQYVLSTYGRFSIEPSHGKGAELWDVEGKRYLDFCTGIAVCALGHAHPQMVSALRAQAEKLMHCSNLYQITAQADLAELITEDCVQLPGKIFFSNSGAEANDGMIKLARKYGHVRPNQKGETRYEILTFQKSFHGRTLGALSATGQEKIQQGFSPLLPGFTYLPFNEVEPLEKAIGDRTVAIMLEPIQGEGGVNSATREFLEAVSALCKKHDLLFMLDEVQCGFGRTGHLMGWRAIHEEIQPDVISWAKGMGGGFPIGGFWVSDRVMPEGEEGLSSLLGPGSHGSTYGGNPLACKVSEAVLREVIDADLCQNVRERSTQIKQEITEWNHPAVSGVRGEGLLLGISLREENLLLPEGTSAALHLCHVLAERGLLVPPAGSAVIRFLPPLNVSEAEVNEALEILREALNFLVSR